MEIVKKVSKELSGMRLDKVSSMIFGDYSRTQLKKWILEGRILLNNELASPRETVSTNDEIEINPISEIKTSWDPEDINFDIIKEEKEYLDRAAMEIEIINSRGFSKYFLTMKAIADRAKETQLVGAGRGSAAGSLVAYALGITQVDPLKYGLQFERFLTKGGAGYPDIDFDIAEPMKLKEPPGEVEGLRGSDASEEPPAK